MATPASRVQDAVASALAQDSPEARAAAVAAVAPADVEQLLHKQFADAKRNVLTRGIAASPGAATGRVYFSAEDAMDAADRGEQVILACSQTSPADEIAMRLSNGILTSQGGLASHAAVVARAWGIPAVCGALDLVFGDRSMHLGDTVVSEGDLISLDGGTGEVMAGAMEVGADEIPAELGVLLEWADAIRAGHLAVRANADSRNEASLAREFGAEGIGLCRTEHQFLGPHLNIVQRFILASSRGEEEAVLDELVKVQRDHLLEVFEAMEGHAVTVRLLDPPLHEFLPQLDHADADPRLLAAARDWDEQNPMLGIRGVRLGILKPALYQAQARALISATLGHLDAGGHPQVEILIPLVADAAELSLVRRWLNEEIDERDLPISIGTMIETPRAALGAAQLAEHADFFSIGTNDLTQLVYGFSRDDVERRLLGVYEANGIVSVSPFESLDPLAVYELIRRAVAEGRQRRPGLRVGVCGEHGGDPASIDLLLEAGVDYVSCSPYRVPIARLVAAQAVLRRR